MTTLEYEQITGQVIGAAMRVHRALGPGFIESIYEEAMAVELLEMGIPFERQVAVPVRYRDRQVGRHRLDLLVAGEVVVELKAVKAIQPVHQAILMSYLRATEKRIGLLINFRAKSLRPQRILNPSAPPDPAVARRVRTKNS